MSRIERKNEMSSIREERERDDMMVAENEKANTKLLRKREGTKKERRMRGSCCKNTKKWL